MPAARILASRARSRLSQAIALIRSPLARAAINGRRSAAVTVVPARSSARTTLSRMADDQAGDFERGERNPHCRPAKSESVRELVLGDIVAGLDLAVNQRLTQPAARLCDLRIGARRLRRQTQ